jgi:hypothetical protein
MANAPYLGAATEAAAARREQMRQRLAPTGLSGIDMFRDPGRAPGRDAGMIAPYLAAAAAAQGPGPFPLALDTGNPPSLLDLIQAANPTRDPRQAMAPGQQGRDPGMLAPYLGPAPRGGPQSMVPGYQAAQPGRPQTNDPGYGASRAMIDDPTYNPSMAMVDDPTTPLPRPTRRLWLRPVRPVARQDPAPFPAAMWAILARGLRS